MSLSLDRRRADASFASTSTSVSTSVSTEHPLSPLSAFHPEASSLPCSSASGSAGAEAAEDRFGFGSGSKIWAQRVTPSSTWPSTALPVTHISNKCEMSALGGMTAERGHSRLRSRSDGPPMRNLPPLTRQLSMSNAQVVPRMWASSTSLMLGGWTHCSPNQPVRPQSSVAQGGQSRHLEIVAAGESRVAGAGAEATEDHRLHNARRAPGAECISSLKCSRF